MAFTMTQYKCLTCSGTYYNPQKDGLEYYHACPPVLVEVDKYEERPDKRDENIGVKLAGKGRDEVKAEIDKEPL